MKNWKKTGGRMALFLPFAFIIVLFECVRISLGRRNYSIDELSIRSKKMKNWKKTGGRMALFLPFAFIIVLFECVPLISMIFKSFIDQGQVTFENFAQIFEKPIYLVAIKNSLWVTMLSATVGLVLDFFLAMALSRDTGKKRTWYLSLLNLTSTFSGVPLTIAFITMLGTAGVFVLLGQKLGFSPLSSYNLYSMKGMFIIYVYFQIPMGTLLLLLGTAGVFVLLGQKLGFSPLSSYNLYSMKGMFIIYVYFQIPMGTLLLLPAFEKVKREWKEAARLMNAGSIRFWFQVGIPVMMPGILGTFNMLFSNAIATYATPYLLVNNSISLLPVKIVDMFVGDVRQRPGMGSALSIILLGIVLLQIGITNMIKKYFEKGMTK